MTIVATGFNQVGNPSMSSSRAVLPTILHCAQSLRVALQLSASDQGAFPPIWIQDWQDNKSRQYGPAQGSGAGIARVRMVVLTF